MNYETVPHDLKNVQLLTLPYMTKVFDQFFTSYLKSVSKVL